MKSTHHDPDRTTDILSKAKAYACRYHAHPFPAEPFFTEILTRCISDAHGTCGSAAINNMEIRRFWAYAKSQALLYIDNALNEIEGPLPIPNQALYYAGKIGTAAENVSIRLRELKAQFQDSGDQLRR